MIAMQYKILLPDDYDMKAIRRRVSDNGYKTDGFQDLLFKAYLISEKSMTGEGVNEYSPLYIWKDSGGMNKFIFEGFYDNILESFGWQKILIGVPLICSFEKEFEQSKYVYEFQYEIVPTQKMKPVNFHLQMDDSMGRILVYNPEKWEYSEYYFFREMPAGHKEGRIYSLLHLSR